MLECLQQHEFDQAACAEQISKFNACMQSHQVSIFTVRNEVAKVRFLHLSVCPQGGGLPQCMLGYPPPGEGTRRQQTPPPLEQTPPWEEAPSPLEQAPSPPWQAPPAPREPDPPEQATPPPPPAAGYCCGRVRILLECILV